MPRTTTVLIPSIAIASAALALSASWMISPARAANQHRAADASIAVVSTPDIMNDLMESDRFAPDRERYAEERRAELQPLADQLQKLQQQLQGMTEEDPQAPALIQQFNQLRNQAIQKQNQINADLEKFTASQVIEAYKLVRSSAQAIAEDLGYDYVITSADEDEDFEPQNVDVALRQIMARPVLLSPEDADITDDVREDLHLE